MPRSRTDTLRAFFAVELDEAARRAAAAVAERLQGGPSGRRIRWVRPENYHVTLRFLGSVERERLAPLTDRARVESRRVAAFSLRLGAVTAFPSPRRPRVVAIELEPPEPLRALAEALERASVECGLPSEARRFRAHLTLGRVRERGFVSAEDVPDAVAFDVDHFVLFQSTLSASGSTYTALERIELPSRTPPSSG